MIMNKELSKKIFLGACLSTVLSANAQADGFSNALSLNTMGKTANKTVKTTTEVATKPFEPTVESVGYSEEFQSIKKLIKSEQFEQAYQQQELKVKEEDTPDFLASNEAGLLALDIKKPLVAIEHFSAAEHFLKMSAADSMVEGAATTFASESASILLGAGELGDYSGAPFERILMLNYKSIAYLLNGERKAYNVTRRAIDWQNIEQKEFEIQLELAKQKIAEESSDASGVAETAGDVASAASNVLSLLVPGVDHLFEEIQKPYEKSKNSALSVSSAYVNPFGFYVAGIVQEFDSFEDRSLRDNARISYQKALDLNPKSKVIKQAIKEVKKPLKRGKRLVQVVISDGFAPEKKSLHFRIPTPGGIIPVKLPVYEIVPSEVAHVRIKSGKKTLATASVVADIEAVTLRHQLDSMPFQHFKVIASITRSSVESVGWSKLGGLGMLLKEVREGFANPDMRSWMSLPKQLLGARFYASKKLKSVTVVSYDKNWKRLASKKVLLPKNEHSIIYVRTIDNILTTNVNKTLWVKAK